MADINQKAWRYLWQQTMEEHDFSGQISLENGESATTYAEMFANIKTYAAVFSALSMTGKNKARVGLVGDIAAETVFAFYGLNLVGAEISVLNILDELKAERLIHAARNEHLTDLILTDDFLQEETMRTLVQKKDELGLRFILLLHVPARSCAVPPPVSIAFEQKSACTRAFWGPLYMDFLMQVYGNHPVVMSDNESSDTAVILHTSGTTGGSSSPIVLSDRALNFMSRAIAEVDGFDELKKTPATGVGVSLSNVYGLIVQLHFPLSLGGKIVMVPGGAVNPYYYRAATCHRMNVLFTGGMVIDMWMKYPETAGFDFSDLKLVVLGGTYISAADKKRYRTFFAKHGAENIPIVNGYGVSELGGVCALSTGEPEDESIGFLMKGFEARFYEEETGRFLSAADAPCTGVLYLNAESMAAVTLDEKPTVRYEEIDGRAFVCTNDLVRMDTDGRLTYLGRANRYFLHKNGGKYPSGRVEMEVSGQPGIESCGIVPVFDKPTHDNVPMLCVTTTAESGEKTETVRKALLDIFGQGKGLPVENLPVQVLIAVNLPKNGSGKIDLYRITREEVEGERYRVEPVINKGGLVNLRLNPMAEEDRDIMQKLYKGIADDIFNESMPGQLHHRMRQNQAAFFGTLPSEQWMALMQQRYNCTMMGWMMQMWKNFHPNNKNGERGNL